MTLTEYIKKCEDEMKITTLHYLLCVQIRDAGLPEPLCEEKLVEGRKFSTDIYWPQLCVEIDGLYSAGGKSGRTGRHLHPVNYEIDCFKQLEITLAHSIPTVHFVPNAINSKYAIWWLTRYLTGNDIGKPVYSPGIKVKKIKEKTSGKKVTASKVKSRTVRRNQGLSA